MSVTIQQIITEYGQYYLGSRSNLSRLQRALTQGSATLAIPGIRHLKTDDTVYEAANVSSTEAVQAYQHGFTPKGDTEFNPNRIPLHHIKVDQQYQPDVIEDNWLGFLAASNNHPKDWPLVRYLLEEVLAKQIEEDRELRMVYVGHAAAPTAGTASTAQTSMDGFKTIITTLAARAYYPIQTIQNIGTLDTATIHDQIEAFAKALPTHLKNQPMVYFVSPEMQLAYLRKKRNMGYYNIAADDQINSRVDFTNHTVVGVPSMTGSTDLWATLPSNILHLTKKTWNPGTFDIQADKRDVNVLGDWREGLGFADNQLVFATLETTRDTSMSEDPQGTQSGNDGDNQDPDPATSLLG